MVQYIVDAFTEHLFQGNPAAVCIMDSWIPESLMMDIAGENRLSETAFAVKEGTSYHLRWFTPGGEIDLCGHATLATAFVLLHFYKKGADQIVFRTKSGDLTVRENGGLFEMDFPAYTLKQVPVTEEMTRALGATPSAAYMGRDLLCVFDREETVKALAPDQDRLRKLDGLLVHATAPGRDCDCVSRSFAPKCGVAEDPVCGSGHCHIAPYWSERLGKPELTAYQASKRGGTIYCRMDGSRVILGGKAVLFSKAELFVPAGQN